MPMDADEKDILNYLTAWRGQYVSAREIARKATTKRRFEKEPNWAVPALGRLVEKGLAESDARAHYRLVVADKKEKSKRWIAPHLQKILEKTGKDFSEGVEIGEPAAGEPSGEKAKPIQDT